MKRISCLKSLVSKSSSTELNFVNGARTSGSGAKTDIFNPAKGEIIGSFLSSTRSDFQNAIEGAQSAQEAWRCVSPMERGNILCEAARLLDQYREEVAQVECLDNGKTITEARFDITSAIDALKYCGGTVPALFGGETQQGSGYKGQSERVPCGLVGGIGAWNYPIQIAGFKAAPSLACGNAVIFKPSQLTPLTAVMFGEILREAGLPDGLYQVLQGEGETGQLICESPDINKITFTGSVPTGIAILSASAKLVRPVTLELGGKSPLMVFDDFDVDNAVQGAMIANFYSQGQVCSNATRVYVHSSIYDVFVDKLISEVQKLPIGNPADDHVRIGALVSKEHKEKVQSYVNQALEEGANLKYGADEPVVPGHENGYFMTPKIFECTDGLTISKEEVFGPLLQLYKFDTEEEVFRRANQTELGLAAGIFTNDFHRIQRFKDTIEAGTLYVNCYNLAPPELGFGGLKMSGLGKENGTEYVSQFTRLKTVFYPTEDNRQMRF